MAEPSVLHVTTGLSVGGAEVMLHELLRETISKTSANGPPGAAVVSLVGGGPLRERIEGLGVPVYELGMRRGRPTPAALWRLARLCGRLGPDVIQGWMYHGNLAATLAAALSPGRTPVVWGVHNSIDDLAAEKRMTAATVRLGARLSARPRRIVYVSRASADQHEAIGYRPDRRAVIPNGFDLGRLRPDAGAYASVRAGLGIPKDAPLVGLIARYHPMKDHANFLDAAGLLAKRDRTVRFVLAGTGVDASNGELAARISEPGLRGRVHLLGERDDVYRITAALDVAASASAWGEAFPMVVGEAMACGVPCVVTDVGDSAWLVGDTGLVVPPRDPVALAAAWEELLRMDRASRTSLGERARARISSNFSLSEITRRYNALYAEVADRAR